MRASGAMSVSLIAALLSAACATGRAADRGQARAAARGPEGFGAPLGAAEGFELGWYDTYGDLAGPGRIAQLGFDFVVPYVHAGNPVQIDAYLDAAEEAGLGVYLDIPRALALERGPALGDYVRRYRERAGVKGWYLFDEPEWKAASRPAAMLRAYEEVRRADGSRPIAQAFMFLGPVGRYADSMDHFWFDWYPFWATSGRFGPLRGGRYADRMLAVGELARRLGKPLMFIAQGYGEDAEGRPQFGHRLPSAAETRYLFYASFLARPQEIAFWCWYRADPAWIEGSLVPAVREFRERFPAGLSYRSSEGAAISGPPCDSIVLENHEGRLWLLVLGRSSRPGPLEISLPAGWSFARGGGKLSLAFEPFGVALAEIIASP